MRLFKSPIAAAVGGFLKIPVWLGLSISVTFANTPQPDDMAGLIEATVAGKKVFLPSLKTDISADIQGDLATVTVVQKFANPYSEPMHAKYLFPLNHDAAVYQMTMDVGDERIRAKIQEKKQAKKTFQKAKREGKAAALLEQHRPNMFTQKIANLMPGLPITVTLRYTQTVQRDAGEYELVVPLIVGPRYEPAAPAQASADADTPAVEQDKVSGWLIDKLPEYPDVHGLTIPDQVDSSRVGLQVVINAGGLPVQAVVSKTHPVNTALNGNGATLVSLQSGRTVDNRDFVLRYSLAGNQTQAGFLSHTDERGGFFSLLIEPPAVPLEQEITPREMVFVLDCSGSMYGQPMDASKAFMTQALRGLRPSDSFRIIRFSDSATEFSSQPVSATPANIRRGLGYVKGLSGSGGTVMTSGVQQAFRPAVPTGSMRIVVFLTDGYIGNEAEVLRLLRKERGDARLYAFGVGTSVNRFLMDEMGHVGRGFTRYMDPTENLEEVAKELASRLDAPLLTDIRIDWGKLSASETSPAIIPDLFAGQSLRIQGRYKQPGEYQIKINGKVNGRPATMPMTVNLAQSSTETSDAIPLIWARSAVKDRMRELRTPRRYRVSELGDDALKASVTQLGLTYELVTKWTSFVAVSEKIYNSTPEQTREAKVALPQVKAVPASAYPRHSGGAAPVAGPLATMLVGLGLWGVAMRRRKSFD